MLNCNFILLDDFGPIAGIALILAIVITFIVGFCITRIKAKKNFYRVLLLIAAGVVVFCFIMWWLLAEI